MKRRYPLIFLLALICLAFSSILSAYMLSEYSTRKFLIAVIPAVILSIILLIDLLMAEKNTLKFIAKINKALSTAESEVLYYSDTPSLILDESFRVLWCNREFSEQILNENEIFAKEIGSCLDINMKALMLDGVTSFEYNGRSYKASTVVVKRNEHKLTFLSLSDITEFAELFSEYKRTRPSVLLIMIDNYEDVLQNFRESEKAQVAAAIETMFEEFMSETTGVMRKISQDRFIAVIEEQHLSEIIKSKFAVLDKARSISIGDKSNIITLSIGVGQGASTLSESETYARQALDMALGRGGDQVAVKTENGFNFFGGIAKGVEKKSRARSRIISNALQELIHNCESVFVMGHKFADLDAVGAGVGLAGAIKQLRENTYFVVDPIKNLSGELIKRIDNEVPGLIISPEKAAMEFDENSLLIIVDTHNAELVESRDLYTAAKHKVVIDHHRKSVNFIDDAVIFHHEPYASSASEMVTEIIQYFKNPSPLLPIYAEALLAGITLDTKNFIMKTGVRTFEAAAYLRRNGADTIRVKELFTSSLEAFKEKSSVIASADIIGNCAISIADGSSDTIRIIAPQAADELLGITGVSASFVIYKTGNVINISARSLGLVNVQVIMEKLGGGGHQTMAAAQIPDTDIQTAKTLLIEALNED